MSKNVVLSNIVSDSKLREIQLNTLKVINDVISKTAGPYGSSTMIMHSPTEQFTEYSKDGHKVLKNIKFFRPLEAAIHDELLGITEYVVKTVGDGTTSAVQLSYRIFEELSFISNSSEFSTRNIIETFCKITEELKEIIDSDKKELTIDDIYEICMISTDGNTAVSREIADIYKRYGTGVVIQVGTSNVAQSILKTYDGVYLNTGYSSPAFINSSSGQVVIKNPRIYYFSDPIDTPEMCALLDGIIMQNMYNPYSKNRPDEFVPTLIMAPSISRDYANDLAALEKIFYSYDSVGPEAKPPFCIVTGINTCINLEEAVLLCDCKAIRKYINPDKQQEDIEKGNAPTNETIVNWYGTCDEVRIDMSKTSFINPVLMFDREKPLDEDGGFRFSSTYESILNHLTKELQIAIQNNEDINVVANLKKRLNSLKSNYVEYLIGGIATADRDNIRDLVEDAILNCKSASDHGYGYGANFEGLRASNILLNKYQNEETTKDNQLYKLIIRTINNAYVGLVKDLYSSLLGNNDEELNLYVEESLEHGKPYNLREKSFNGYRVLCSIETDKVILDAISKIITVMFTSNQALLNDPMQNCYLETNN